MNNKTITECAYFEAIDGIRDDDFIAIIDELEKSFHMPQQGYIDTELVRGKEERQWLMIQHWESLDDAKNASRNLMRDAAADVFRNSIVPKTVRISYHERVSVWIKE